MEALQIDFVGPITPRSNDGSGSILVVTDLFSRYAEAFNLKDQTAPLVARTLVTQFFCRYGAPTKIHSDQGTNFMSNLIKEIMKLYQVHHVQGSSYRPQSQGSVERLNRTLIEMLKHYTIHDVFEWSEYIPYVISAYNSSVHSSTLYTPYELFYGRKVQLPLDVLINKPSPKYKDVDNYHQEVAERLHISHQLARRNAAEARKAQAKYYNYRSKKRDFRCGDQVYITNEAKKAKRRTGTDEKGNVDSRKFRMSWIGPCTIISRKGDVVFEVRHDDTGKLETIHQDRMKLTYDSKIARKARKENTKQDSSPIRQDRPLLRSYFRKSRQQENESHWWKNDDADSNSDSNSDDSSDQELIPEETIESDLDLSESEEGSELSEEEIDPRENLPVGENDDPEPKISSKTEVTGEENNQETGRQETTPSPEIVPSATDHVTLPPTFDSVPSRTDLAESPPTTPKEKINIETRKSTPEFRPGADWWRQLKRSPQKNVPPTPAIPSTRELTKTRQNELKLQFDKAWKRKVTHESKFKSNYPLNLQQVAATESELTISNN